MSRQGFHPLVFLIIGLAVFGLGYRLMTDPFGLISQFLLYAAIALGLFFLYKRFMAKKMGAPVNSYRQKNVRVKNTSNVVPHKRKQSAKKGFSKPLQKRRNDHNLTVIEGKKSKRKNRALF